jgi:pimeloyl-ACP methyl ester carboxylesterase
MDNRKHIAALLISLFLLLPIIPATAQGDALPEPEFVEVTAGDGIRLVGDFYALTDADSEMPTVILLHGITSNRHEWEPLVVPLLDNGYHVLTVDQRAHGESEGDRDLAAAIGDVQVWLDWLREQPTVADDGISIIGGSWGAVPALGGCAADEGCVTAVAVSPGDFPLLDEALFEQYGKRGVLFIVGRDDNVIYDTYKLFNRTSGAAAMYVYDTAAHATSLISPRNSYRDAVIDLLLDWLREQVEAQFAHRE